MCTIMAITALSGLSHNVLHSTTVSSKVTGILAKFIGSIYLGRA